MASATDQGIRLSSHMQERDGLNTVLTCHSNSEKKKMLCDADGLLLRGCSIVISVRLSRLSAEHT